MDSSYRPQSPDLSSYAPKSPDLSAYQPQSPDLTSAFPVGQIGIPHSPVRDQFGGPFGHSPYSYGSGPTSIPVQPQYVHPGQYDMPPASRFKTEDADEDYLPNAPARRGRKAHQSLPGLDANGLPYGNQPSQFAAPLQGTPAQQRDPTLGVQLKTSFPVARIKRIMQADEDIGKVAQVTPHVVSRALELFMIKLISASAGEARGGPGANVSGGKGPKRILAQHMKRAITSDDTCDFLADIVNKVPDAAPKTKKEAGSDSEDGASGSVKPARRKGKKRKDSGDDF